ncbi:type II toxin-antitoxin system HipA family toxin [Hydrogenophaga sp. OTU3427]|uniref:type II toxin-antitoxin system HipA family toxin n=1 Tax=Hydrogenophaga sp. OTU3427 TaxID=3043856 RepID=UPI00313D8DC9
MNTTTDAPQDLSLLVPTGADGVRIDRALEVTLGQDHRVLGKLLHHKNGSTECSMFTYSRQWLERQNSFNISPDLRLIGSSQCQRAETPHQAPFFGTLADTLPSGFAHRVVQRADEQGLLDRSASASVDLNDADRLCAVHDFCRVGALRLRPLGSDRRNNSVNWKLLPRIFDLEAMINAAHAFENETEDHRQLMLLVYSATSLGGSRPKCSFVQEVGTLALAKFPSVFDRYPITRAEVLATYLAKTAGIRVADTRLKLIVNTPVAIVQRFDRATAGGRRHYMRATTLLQAHNGEVIDHHGLLRGMRQCCKNFKADARELWRRQVFKLLINKPDADLHKIDFLHVGANRWELAPAYDLTPGTPAELGGGPRPGARLAGPTDVELLLRAAPDFQVGSVEALEILEQLIRIVSGWSAAASLFAVGMSRNDIERMQPIFDNAHTGSARQLLHDWRSRRRPSARTA